MKKKFKNVIQSLKNYYTNTLFFLKYFKKYKVGKKCIYLSIINSIIDIVPSIAYMIIPGLIINTLLSKPSFEIIIVYLICLSAINVLVYIKNRTMVIRINSYKRELKRLFQADLQNYLSSIEYSILECPEVAVEINRLSMNIPDSPFDILNLCCGLISSLVSILSLILIVAYLSPFIIIVLLAIIGINSLVTKKINNANYMFGKQISEKQNKYWAEFYNLTNYSNGKEIRVFDVKDFFIERYTSIGREIDQISLCEDKYQKKWMLVHVVTNIAQQVFLYIFAALQVVYFGMPIGTLTIFLNAANQFSGTLGGVTNIFLELSKYSLHANEIREFMNHPTINNTEGELSVSIFDNSVIEFKDVSFKYPGSDRYVLSNLNIKIQANDVLCIVGENGSGKSTFVKLLTRLYEPTDGGIYLDGRNINQYNIAAYQKLFSPVFQDYSEYSLPIDLSIALEKKPCMTKVEESIDKSGLSSLIKKLSKGTNTYIGKSVEEDGFEPSGGEAQRIAIARALYHEGMIFILDEPTASLDPNAEHEIYTKFHNMIQGKTAIMITHRLSAVQLANKIAVFDNGHIIEYGNHTELYAKGGKYTEMFDKQAQFYRDNPCENKNTD